MIPTPKSAKRDSAFGNHKTLYLPVDTYPCQYTVIFDQEFSVINVIEFDGSHFERESHFEQFGTIAELNAFLATKGIAPVEV